MAYKFQFGNAKLGGTLQQDGGLVSTDVDDATAANIVAEIDNGEIASTKVALASGKVLIGDASGHAAAQTMGGDATIAANGTLSIADNAVGLDEMAGIARGKLIAGDASGNPVYLAAGAQHRVLATTNADGDLAFSQVSNDMLAGSIANAKLANNAVTIGSTSVQLGATEPSLNGIQGFTLSNNNNRIIEIAATAHDVAGKHLEIRAGNTTAGTTNNIAGGNLVLQAGQGKGTGAGGSISFKVATAAGSSGHGANAANNALVIGQDKNAQFAGNVTVDGDLLVSGDTITMNVGELLVEDKIIQVAKAANDQATSKDSGILFGQAHANGAQLLYEVDGGIQKLKAKQGTGTTLIKMEASEFIGPATKGKINDEENVNSARLVLFADATGAQDFKSDGDFTYNSGLNGGTLSAPKFVGNGAGLTGVPMGVRGVADKGASGSPVALDNMKYNILNNNSQGNGTHLFSVSGVFANGDEIKVKAPSDAASNRIYRVTASAALTFDGQSTIDLVSPDAAITLVYVGADKFKIF